MKAIIEPIQDYKPEFHPYRLILEVTSEIEETAIKQAWQVIVENYHYGRAVFSESLKLLEAHQHG